MGINLNGTGGGIVLNGTRDPGLEKSIADEIAARKAADEALDAKKTDKPTLSSDTLEITINTDVKDVNVPTVTGMDSEIASLRTSMVGSLETLNSGKADKANEDGGFNGGQSTQAAQGGAVGKSATADTGGAVGYDAYAVTGGAVGYNSNTDTGGAVGSTAHSSGGGAVGQGSETTNGGAVGQSAVAGDGFAGGKNAQATKNDEPIDAVQLGTGVNQNPKTLQVYSYQLMDSTGHIPNDRMPTKSDQPTYYNPTTGSAITYDLKNEHNRMTSYVNASSAATSVAISVSDGVYNNDFISELSFYTGDTPPEFSYPSSPYIMYFIGAECTQSSTGASIFSPLANKVYEIIFYFNGGYIIGLVNGYNHVS